MNTYEELMNAALALPADARATLAQHLIESLDTDDQQTIDALWAEEAERRAKEIESGLVKAIQGDEVMNRLQSRYKR